MRIVIGDIDKDSFELRGYAPTPSFVVQFSSATFSGTARLVPYSGVADAKTGDEFFVEIAQGSVSGFRLNGAVEPPAVVPLPTPGDFEVRGTVRHVWYPSEPAGNRITEVNVGDADFSLSLEDIGHFRPDIGTKVEFVVHDLSMWDESI